MIAAVGGPAPPTPRLMGYSIFILLYKMKCVGNFVKGGETKNAENKKNSRAAAFWEITDLGLELLMFRKLDFGKRHQTNILIYV